jgi:GT2 family glycosyltransferase
LIVARVSIVVVNWNGRRYLDACLGSIADQEFRDVETILVDNASTDGSLALVRERFPWVRTLENAMNLGFAAANNQAFRECSGEYIALLNNDTEVDRLWLSHLVDALDAAPRAGGVCGTVRSLDDRDRVLVTLPKVDPRTGRAIWVNQAARAGPVDYLSGNSMLIRRSALERIGELDAAYVAYFEETDWCARALRAGYDLLYVPEAVVWHKEAGSASASFHAYQMARNRIRFALKNFDVSALPGFVLFLGLDIGRDLLRAIRDRAWGRIWLTLRALGWNVTHLAETLAARRLDLGRLGATRSYNRSLPLRRTRSDGRGGLVRPPSTSRS